MVSWFPGGSPQDETIGYYCSRCDEMVKKGDEKIINFHGRGDRIICANCDKIIKESFGAKTKEVEQ